MSERNGKNKIHNIINKAMKGVVVFALFLFIIFVLKNKAEFSEKIAKGGPDKEISQIAVTGNDEIVQKFKATYDNIQSFTFMIDRNQSYKEQEVFLLISRTAKENQFIMSQKICWMWME